MSYLDFETNPNDTGRSHWWTYADEKKDGYRPQVTGTVLGFQEVQKKDYKTRQPEFYPDGNPKMQIRMNFCEQDKDYTSIEFAKKGALHKALWDIAPADANGRKDMNLLVGQTIDVWTEPGVYNQTHPRPWHAQISKSGPFELAGDLPEWLTKERVLYDAPKDEPATVGTASAPYYQAPTGAPVPPAQYVQANPQPQINMPQQAPAQPQAQPYPPQQQTPYDPNIPF